MNQLYVSLKHQKSIRILIYVPGSMNLNDPRNLRQPSLRLITGLLNDGNNAGIWTFGQYVNMLVKQGPVNDEWKARARSASAEINSYGLRTNIEGALRDATWDWMRPTEHQQQQSLILLTDGLVDIADDNDLNQASRKRILDDILPRLQQAGINIHTIALSEDADTELLAQLSTATQGIHTNVKTSKELERVFLRLFEASTASETLPLNDNRFKVDKSIHEMTLLVFHQSNAKATHISQPDGTIIDNQNNPENVNWHSEDNYDLVTIKHPIQGDWEIQAKLDPDNRVVIVSDLKLESNLIPANIGKEDSHTIDIRLSQQGEPIINKDFLHFIKVSAVQYNKKGNQTREWTLFDNGLRNDRRENDGIYSLTLENFTEEGSHELVIDIDGTTFTRQQRQHFQVFNQPVITAIESGRHGLTLYAAPIAGLIDPESMTLSARVDDSQNDIAIPRLHQNEWGLTLQNVDMQSPHTVTIHLTGRRNEKEIDRDLDTLSFGHRPKTREFDPSQGQQNEEAVTTKHDQDAHADNLKSETVEPINNISPLTVLINVILINLLGAGLLFFLYKKYNHVFIKYKLARGTHQ